MLAVERSADASGLSYDAMMRNAGRGIADWVHEHIPCGRSVVGLIGSGNNGGDTIIALTWLAQWGLRTTAFLVKPRGDDPLLGEYLLQGGAVVDLSENTNLEFFEAALIPSAVLLDGILGTGLKLPLRGTLLKVMSSVSERVKNSSDMLKIAVDCPSGVDCDTGEVSEVTIVADHTLYMAAMKQGLLRHPARSYAGELHYIGIGIEDLSEHLNDDLPVMMDQELIGKILPQRPAHGHKGTFGTCLVIAGSPAFTGAAFLTGKAAYRAGCGLVHMATLQEVYHHLSGQLIEAVWTVLPGNQGAYDPLGADQLRHIILGVDSIVIGPGWGLSASNMAFLAALLDTIPADTPTLLDADALKLLAELDRWWTRLPDQAVLTPHPGEMSVLTGLDIHEIQANRWAVAMEYAHHWQVNLVLKGAVSVLASQKEGLWINPASDTALATAGSGDILSGVIGGLLAQGVPAHASSVLGVWVHANAGKAAGRRLGTAISVTALDILESLPAAFVKATEAGA
jgi:NAD(P)H-hydrate epimerase